VTNSPVSEGAIQILTYLHLTDLLTMAHFIPVQLGTVAFFWNPSMAPFKANGTMKDTKHPHVVVNIDTNGYATLMPMTSKGDTLHQKNVNHFIPPEACSVLTQPTWPLAQMEYLTVHVSEFPWNKGLLTTAALDIVFAYYDAYWDSWKHQKKFQVLWIPFSGCTYEVSTTVWFPDALTTTVYEDLGMQPLTLAQATAKAKAKYLAKKKK
jgi:hypothetical protein